MSKINIKTTLISPEGTTENKTKGIKMSNKLSYSENDFKVSIDIIDNSVNMTTKSDEHVLELLFKEGTETKGKYTLLHNNVEVTLNIFTKLLQISDNYIKIRYVFNEEERLYEIEYEEIV